MKVWNDLEAFCQLYQVIGCPQSDKTDSKV